MKPGSLKWKTLAKMDNQAIYDYFRNIQGHDPKHAFFSTRRVRSLFDASGKRFPREQYVPVSFFTPANGEFVPNGGSRENEQPEQPQTDPFEKIHIFKIETETEEIEEMKNTQNNDAAQTLAAMIAPAMAGMVSSEIEKAVAKIYETMAPVKQLVVMRDKLEVNLGDLTHEKAPEVIQLVNQGLHVMLVGPAGSGKTMLAHTVAEALGRPMTLISCSAGMSEAQLLGRLLPLGANGAFTYVESPFMKAYANGGVILLDEMDAADANLLLVINAALANGGITVEARAALGPDANTYVQRHPDTVIIAAANTWGGGADTQYVGRGALDVSTLDRFFRLPIDYDTNLESKLGAVQVVRWVHEVRRKARECKLRRVVSTRMITRMEKAVAAGMTWAEAKTYELSSWTPDERAKVGE